MGLVNVDHRNFRFDDVNFDDEYPETIIHVRLIAWFNRCK